MAGINFITAKEGFQIHSIQSFYLNKHTRLVVRVGGEGLGLFGWNGGVTVMTSQRSRYPGTGGGDVQQKQVLDIPTCHQTGWQLKTIQVKLLTSYRINITTWAIVAQTSKEGVGPSLVFQPLAETTNGRNKLHHSDLRAAEVQ